MRAKDFKRTFDNKDFGDMVDFINSIFQNGLTLEDNLGGQIIKDIELPSAGTQIKVPHRLKAVPKYRIILRQDGAGSIIDEGEWNESFITLSISGATKNTKITILLMRG